jgi:hypothetical protein
MGVKKTPDEDLESFLWLKNWRPDTLFGPKLGADIMCKICDKYISLTIVEDHIDYHKKERESLIKRKKKAAAKLRAENLRKAREEKKLMLNSNES